MRFKTWPVAALGLGSLLILIVLTMLASARKAQDIYTELDHLNTYHQDVDAKLRRLRSDVNLSGIFVRDYLLDVESDRAPEYRQELAEFHRANLATLTELGALAKTDRERIAALQTQLDDYWETFEPLFDWTPAQKILRSASFLRREVVPRREAVLAIAQEIEELNNANLAVQRAEVARRQTAFHDDLHRLLWQSVLLGLAVALLAVFRLRAARSRAGSGTPDAPALAATRGRAGRGAEAPLSRAARSCRSGAHGLAYGARAHRSGEIASGYASRRRRRRGEETGRRYVSYGSRPGARPQAQYAG
jgi:hypothetical protein